MKSGISGDMKSIAWATIHILDVLCCNDLIDGYY